MKLCAKYWSSWCSLVQCNLVDNQYQQKSKVLYTFNSNKSYVYLLNVEPSNLVFNWLLEIEDKFNLTLLINREMMQYSIEPRTRKHVKGYRFFSFSGKYRKQLLDTGLDAL